MICPHCHFENKDGAKFCNECGASLTGVSVEEDARSEEARGKEDAPPSENDGLDSRELPVIEVEGVNVDDRGEPFDFDDIDDDLFKEGPEDGSPDVPESTKTGSSGRSKANDLSGIDEYLVDAGYNPPKAAWRSGDTMEMPRVGDEAPSKQVEFRAPDPKEGKRGGHKGKVVVFILAVLVIAAAGTAAITYHMELWGGKTLPDVVGYTQQDAEYVLEGKGFVVRVMQAKSDETEGIVLLTDPSGGTREELGTEVSLHISVARKIPDVAGRQRDEAARLCEEEGLENVMFLEQKSDTHEGTVLSISPEAGTKAKAATPVTIAVAVPYTVPDVSGMGKDDAASALAEAGYTSQVSYEYNEDVEAGTVLRTDPVSGEKLASGAMVTMVVALSRAAELESAALSYLQNAGTVNIGGTTYEIASVDAVAYLGNEQTSFTITGSAVTTLDGETVRGSSKQKSGTITWNSANEIVDIS